jgi:diguanylate cyclase (GGDEF)-like protein
MTSNPLALYQLLLVAVLAAIGLGLLYRWLRTEAAKFWAMSWLAAVIGLGIASLGHRLPDIDHRIVLLVHLVFVALFCFYLAQGCIAHTRMEDVKLYQTRMTLYSVVTLLSLLSLLIVIFRWDASPYPLREERYLWRSPWLISFGAFAGWIITRYQKRWYLRQSQVLFVTGLGLMACLQVFLVACVMVPSPGEHTHFLFRVLTGIEPIAFAFLALAMHVLVIDGLVSHLEQTLVQVSKNSAKLRVMAERDPLTAVLNRHAFYSLMAGQRTDEAKQPLGGSVAVIDIDNLKPLNDQHGHQTGDAAIRAVAKAIRSVVRAEDLLFRWGGDEFLAILPHVNLEEARWRFQKLDDILNNTDLPGIDEPVAITLSVGVSPFSTSHSLEKAIEEADERMYSRKSEKKARAKSST